MSRGWWFALCGLAAAALLIAGLFIAAIWTADDRFGQTAAVLLGLLVSAVVIGPLVAELMEEDR